ncbi:MAG: cytochrome c [Myxococcota bacterium]
MRRLPRRVQGRRGSPLIGWAASALAADPAWGEVLAGLAGCRECHTTEGGAPYAGGPPLDTEFGTFRGSNLTPDPDHGIGGWSEAEFERALRRGEAPGGHALWPAFPYPAFTRLSDGDVADLWAYLRTVPPAATPDPPQEIDRSRAALHAWRWLVFRARPWRALDDPQLDRGAYLVEVVGHCSGCHSRRDAVGRERDPLAGSDQPPHGGPNLTPHADGLVGWTEGDWTTFLDLGMTPDGEFVGGGMRHVIRDGTRHLSDQDRLAMARYLRALPPRPTPERERSAGSPPAE